MLLHRSFLIALIICAGVCAGTGLSNPAVADPAANPAAGKFEWDPDIVKTMNEFALENIERINNTLSLIVHNFGRSLTEKELKSIYGKHSGKAQLLFEELYGYMPSASPHHQGFYNFLALVKFARDRDTKHVSGLIDEVMGKDTYQTYIKNVHTAAKETLEFYQVVAAGKVPTLKELAELFKALADVDEKIRLTELPGAALVKDRSGRAHKVVEKLNDLNTKKNTIKEQITKITSQEEKLAKVLTLADIDLDKEINQRKDYLVRLATREIKKSVDVGYYQTQAEELHKYLTAIAKDHAKYVKILRLAGINLDAALKEFARRFLPQEEKKRHLFPRPEKETVIWDKQHKVVYLDRYAKRLAIQLDNPDVEAEARDIAAMISQWERGGFKENGAPSRDEMVHLVRHVRENLEPELKRLEPYLRSIERSLELQYPGAHDDWKEPLVTQLPLDEGSHVVVGDGGRAMVPLIHGKSPEPGEQVKEGKWKHGKLMLQDSPVGAVLEIRVPLDVLEAYPEALQHASLHLEIDAGPALDVRVSRGLREGATRPFNRPHYVEVLHEFRPGLSRVTSTHLEVLPAFGIRTAEDHAKATTDVVFIEFLPVPGRIQPLTTRPSRQTVRLHACWLTELRVTDPGRGGNVRFISPLWEGESVVPDTARFLVHRRGRDAKDWREIDIVALDGVQMREVHKEQRNYVEFAYKDRRAAASTEYAYCVQHRCALMLRPKQLLCRLPPKFPIRYRGDGDRMYDLKNVCQTDGGPSGEHKSCKSTSTIEIGLNPDGTADVSIAHGGYAAPGFSGEVYCREGSQQAQRYRGTHDGKGSFKIDKTLRGKPIAPITGTFDGNRISGGTQKVETKTMEVDWPTCPKGKQLHTTKLSFEIKAIKKE